MFTEPQIARKSHRKTSRYFGSSRNLNQAESVIYSNPRYDGGRFTLSPQKRPPLLLLNQVSLAGNSFEERSAQVALAGIRQNHYQHLALHLGFLGDTRCRGNRCPARDSRENPFFPSQPARHFHGLLIGYLLH